MGPIAPVEDRNRGPWPLNPTGQTACHHLGFPRDGLWRGFLGSAQDAPASSLRVAKRCRRVPLCAFTEEKHLESFAMLGSGERTGRRARLAYPEAVRVA